MTGEERTYTMEEIERETGLDRRTIAYYVQEGLLPKVGRRGPRTRYSKQFIDRLMFIQKIRGLQDLGQLGNYTLDDIREIFETVPEHLIADIVSGKEPLDVAPYGGTLRRRPDTLGSPGERIERLRQLSERRRSAYGVVRQDLEPLLEPPRRPEQLMLRKAGPGDLASRGLSRLEDRQEELPASRPAPHAAIPPPASTGGDEPTIFLDLDLEPPDGELLVKPVLTEADAATVAHRMPRADRTQLPPHPLTRLLARLDRAAGQAPKGTIAQSWTRAEVTPDIVLTVRGLDQESARLLARVARLLRSIIEAGRGQRGG